MKALALVKRNKILVGIMLLFLGLLIPTVVLATVGGNTFIGMQNIVHSNLYIGTGLHGQWWVGFNVPATYINPSSPVGGFINLFPLIFIAMAVLMVIWMGIKNEWGMVGTIIVMAIVIYIAIALLKGMNVMNVNILGV